MVGLPHNRPRVVPSSAAGCVALAARGAHGCDAVRRLKDDVCNTTPRDDDLASADWLCWDAKNSNMREACMRQVDYYFSLSSPWAYIGHKTFRDVVATYGLKVNHKPVVLVDLFSETGGLPLVKRHPVRQRYRALELQRWRDKRGLK